MKKIVVSAAFLFLGLSLVPGSGLAAYAPHNETNAISCTSCHELDGLLGLGRAAFQNQFFLKDCETCHNNDTGANYDKNNAPLVRTHSSAVIGSTKYGNWARECWDCHGHGRAETALVTGTFSGPVYDAASNTTTLGMDSFTVLDPAWEDPLDWNRKSGEERGLILSFDYFDPTEQQEMTASFEIVGADSASVTVRGEVSQAETASFKISYGQMIRKKIAGQYNATFTGPASFAYDESGTGTDSTPDGVCQVCHTQTRYWRNDGTMASHNNGIACTECHAHVNGFRPSCDVCHGAPPILSQPGAPSGLVFKPAPTGSVTAGQHELHATASGYNFPCETCHTGGMPQSEIIGNNLLQIGFSIYGFDSTGTAYDGQAGVAYQGTNGTTVSNNGTMKCANVYCHSAGKTPAVGYDVPSISPAWNGSSPDPQGDANKCNNCHTYPPGFDRHKFHASWGISDCSICHYATTHDGVTIADRTKHVNGQYDVVPSGSYVNYRGQTVNFSFIYTYAPGGGTCSANTCHGQAGFPLTIAWVNRDLYLDAAMTATESVDPASGSGVCGSMDFRVGETVTEDIVPPFTCDYDFDGDGIFEVTGGACDQTHVYGDPATFGWDRIYTVNWSVRDSVGNTIASPNPRPQQVVVCPSPNVLPTVQGTVQPLYDGKFGVKLNDTSYDPDYNLYNRVGPGRIRIDWGDGTPVEEFDVALTDMAVSHAYTHNYRGGGIYYVKYAVKDNALSTQWVDASTKTVVVYY